MARKSKTEIINDFILLKSTYIYVITPKDPEKGTQRNISIVSVNRKDADACIAGNFPDYIATFISSPTTIFIK